jgi:hypothetical protein
MTAPYPSPPAPWIKPLLLLIALALLIIAALLIVQLDLFQPADSTRAVWLPGQTETRVSFAPGDSQRLYRFDAQADDVTVLRLDGETDNFAFAAEVQDSAGETVAVFNGALETFELELEAGDGLYQVMVASADPERYGTIRLSLDEGQITEVGAAVAYMPLAAPRCSALNPGSTDLLVRSAPSDSFSILGTLSPAMTIPALGRTDSGWVAVNYAERQGWISDDVTILQGECAALPQVLDPTIPSAPADVQVYGIEVDRDGEGTFREVISTPEGDSNDLVWISIVNLHTEPPNNYREFSLTLNCEGAGLEAVRWGSAYSPTLVCGQSVVVPFIHGASQQPFSVVLPEGSRQSYVQYSLQVTPGGSVG